MSELLDRYRLNAEKCLKLAQTFKDPDTKLSMLLMAEAWLALAMQRAKTLEATPANESSSPASSAGGGD